MIALVALVLVGCGNTLECGDPGQVLAEAGAERLTCADTAVVVAWVELLAGRPVSAGDRGMANADLARRFSQDPDGTLAWLDRVRADGAALAAMTGLEGAEARGERIWRTDRGEDLVRPADGRLWNLQSRALSVWTKDEEEHLALAESDLEAWIRYASLCREAQGAGVLRVSVGDRVRVYQMLIDRFDGGDRATQVALLAFGAVWSDVKDHWQLASYDRQQAWISAAPLPGPMTATSLGYADAVFGGDVVGHARAVHERLGPLPLGRASDFTARGSPP